MALQQTGFGARGRFGTTTSYASERNAMYIGIGTVVVILIVLLLIGVLR